MPGEMLALHELVYAARRALEEQKTFDQTILRFEREILHYNSMWPAVSPYRTRYQIQEGLIPLCIDRLTRTYVRFKLCKLNPSGL